MQAKLDKQALRTLYRAVLALGTEEDCDIFFEDLCTVQELKALSQRLQVAVMLDGDKVYNDIVAETGASTATISRVNRCLHYGRGGYRLVLDRLARLEE